MKVVMQVCPFCGTRPKIRRAQFYYAKYWIVECRSTRCGVNPQTTPCDRRGVARGKDGAIVAWNSRLKQYNMKVKDLIKKLSQLPENMQVSVWDGYNLEYVTNIKMDIVSAKRFRIKEKDISETAKEAGYSATKGVWTDSTMSDRHFETKKFANISIGKRPQIKF